MSSIQLSPHHLNIKIQDYNTGYINGEYTLPVWQRQDCWGKTDYRKSLIESIMMGIDLPKIYIGNIQDMGKVIIDGGHRTRAINAYLNNEYPISIIDDTEDGPMEKMVYYSESPTNTRKTRKMTDQERDYFNNYSKFMP